MLTASPDARLHETMPTRARVSWGTLVLVAFASFAALAQAPPVVPPSIGDTYSNDSDNDRLDDTLQVRFKSARAKSSVDETVDVELIFKQPPTQAQIDVFLAEGGTITYQYQAVSYGWNGRVPLSQVDGLPSAMGATLVLVTAPRPAKTHLQLATQCGRVRPVWADGFAGRSGGFQGDSTITIAIIDTGVDASHSDLIGRRVYWRDFSGDGTTSPVDVLQHGSHVTGIATGSGAASGATTGTLYYTDSGSLSGVPSGSLYPSPIWLPSGTVTLTSHRQVARRRHYLALRGPTAPSETPALPSAPFPPPLKAHRPCPRPTRSRSIPPTSTWPDSSATAPSAPMRSPTRC